MLPRKAIAAGLLLLLVSCTNHHATPPRPRVTAAPSAAGTGGTGGTEAIADFRPGTRKSVVTSIAADCRRAAGVAKVLPALMHTGPQKIPTVTFELGYYEPRDQSRFRALRRCLVHHPEVSGVIVPM